MYKAGFCTISSFYSCVDMSKHHNWCVYIYIYTHTHTHTLADESKNQKSKTKVMMETRHTNIKLTTLRSRTLNATSTCDRDTAPETKTKTRRFKEESQPGGQHSPSTMTSSRVTLEHASKRKVYNSCILPATTYGAETWALATQAKSKLAAAQTKMERSMLNITYRNRNTNIWLRKKTKVTDVIEQVRRWKWTWAGDVSRIRDNRWTPHITSWKPYERKRPRHWRDELDDYWKVPGRG